MIRDGIRSSIAFGLLLAAGAQAQQGLPPASAFAALPEMSFVRLSPDGQKIAWANDPGGTPVVVIMDLATGRDLQRLQPPNAKVRDLDWADNRTLIMSVSRSLTQSGSQIAEQRYEFQRFLAVDADSKDGKARSLLMEGAGRELVTSASLVNVHPAKPETVIMSTWNFSGTAYRQELGSRLSGGRKDSGYEYSLFEVNTRTGDGKLIETGTPWTDDWVVNAAGEAVARSDWNPETGTFSIFTKDGKSWKTVYSAAIDYELDLIGATPDGQQLLLRGSRGQDKFRIWSMPVGGGDFSVYYEHPEQDVTGVSMDRFSGAPVSYHIGGPVPKTVWVDPKMESMQKAVGKAFAGRIATVFDRSQDYKRIVARVESASQAPVYYLIDFNKGTADIIGETYPGLAEATLGTLETTSYRSRDGLEIPAYLILPPGRKPEKLPLVVLPHGGPYARDDQGFDWLAQFLATRGYVVLQPQFRGSWGFGAAHMRAGNRQWGRAMQDDITDGVKYLVDKGTADPARVCIVGGSYGGYAAVAGAAFTPDLYRCAVSINGVSDIPNLIGYERKHYGDDSSAYRGWKDLIGNPTDDELAKFSPARSIQTIKAPILLFHGTNDSVVPPSQSENFARLMAEGGRHADYVKLEGEDHWLSGSASRLKLLQLIEPFLASYLKP